MAVQIPPRNTSKYAGHYSRALGSQRMVEIFVDSYKIALSSKNRETASDRFALAVEAYYQFISMESAEAVRAPIQKAMEELVEFFPTKVVANEALGLREKARKLKTPRKQLELLQRADEIVNRGLAEHASSSVLHTAASELRTEISRVNSNITSKANQ